MLEQLPELALLQRIATSNLENFQKLALKFSHSSGESNISRFQSISTPHRVKSDRTGYSAKIAARCHPAILIMRIAAMF